MAPTVRVRMGIHTGEPGRAAASGTSASDVAPRPTPICAARRTAARCSCPQTTRELLRDDPVRTALSAIWASTGSRTSMSPSGSTSSSRRGSRESFPELKTAALDALRRSRRVAGGGCGRGDGEELAAAMPPRPDRRDLRRSGSWASPSACSLTQGGGSTASASMRAERGRGDRSGERRHRLGDPGGRGAGRGRCRIRRRSGSLTPNDNTVSRIDPSTNQVVQTVSVGGGPAGVATGGGAVWVANGLDGTVSRIDPNDEPAV